MTPEERQPEEEEVEKEDPSKTTPLPPPPHTLRKPISQLIDGPGRVEGEEALFTQALKGKFRLHPSLPHLTRDVARETDDTQLRKLRLQQINSLSRIT